MKIKNILLAAFMLATSSIVAQTVVQPKIMVIPYTKEGENIRTILEADENKRIVLTKIKEAFDERGVSTIDFVAKLKAMESGNVFNLENKQDAKSLIIDMSGADIYVEAEIVCQQGHTSGKPCKNCTYCIRIRYGCLFGKQGGRKRYILHARHWQIRNESNNILC